MRLAESHVSHREKTVGGRQTRRSVIQDIGDSTLTLSATANPTRLRVGDMVVWRGNLAKVEELGKGTRKWELCAYARQSEVESRERKGIKVAPDRPENRVHQRGIAATSLQMAIFCRRGCGRCFANEMSRAEHEQTQRQWLKNESSIRIMYE